MSLLLAMFTAAKRPVNSMWRKGGTFYARRSPMSNIASGRSRQHVKHWLSNLLKLSIVCSFCPSFRLSFTDFLRILWFYLNSFFFSPPPFSLFVLFSLSSSNFACYYSITFAFPSSVHFSASLDYPISQLFLSLLFLYAVFSLLSL